MNQATIYRRINMSSRRDVQNIVEQVHLQWRKDGRDSLIDIGTGTGDVLMDFIHPMMPSNFELVLGTDISAKMINYANDCYDGCDRTQFMVLDIGADRMPLNLQGHFDHVTSFYCLHWIQNQRQMLANIYDLLRTEEGGDCLLVLVASHFLYYAYTTLSKYSKWSIYMQDYEKFISPYHNQPRAAAEFRELLVNAGFIDCHVELQKKTYIYEGLQGIRDFVSAICPFLERLPNASLKEEFVSDFVKLMVDLDLRQDKKDSTDHDYVMKYELIVAYARKSRVL